MQAPNSRTRSTKEIGPPCFLGHAQTIEIHWRLQRTKWIMGLQAEVYCFTRSEMFLIVFLGKG